ncbi:hypothetical protein [Fontibacter flavus]|uniref:Uncharacterized protein n=1 Tax=Fontibacter flavus TaxID=654838 RepID=A0ABV6FVE2_9BACT
MKKLVYSLGLPILIIGFFLLPFDSVNGQSTSDCNWVGSSHGCDVYDCGRCIMWACGTSGGMLVCEEEESE